jgi:hypothetical protein
MATLILSDGTRSIDFLSASGFKVPQDGINLPVVSREDTFAEGSDSEGRSRVRSRATNSTAGQISLYLSGATASALWTTIDNLQELVESAHLNKGSISYLGPGASSTVTYDLESISVTDLPQVGIELTQLRCNATISFESKPYGRLATQRLNVQDSYQAMVTALSPSIFLPLGASSGLTDLSGNARNGTAAGGVTVGGATGPLTVSDGGATDFDGTDDRITTTYATRRNLCVDPLFNLGNLSKWSAFTSTAAIVSTTLPTGLGGGTGNVCEVTPSGANGGIKTYDSAASPSGGMPATAAPHRAGFWMKTDGTTQTMSVQFVCWNAGGTAFDTHVYNPTVTSAWTWVSTADVAQAGTTRIVVNIRASGTYVGTKFSFVGLMLEEGNAVAPIESEHFPNTAQLASGEAGWTGTANASASDIGCFANGTTRTFMGWAYRDTSSGVDTIFSGSGATPPVLAFSSGSQNIVWKPDNSTTTTWASGISNGTWFHWELEFAEPTASNNASLYINGALISAQTNAGQYSANCGNFQLGALTSTTDPFDGRQAWVSVHQTALTATQIRDAYDAGKAQITLDGPIDSFVVSGVTGQVNAWPDFTLYESSGATVNHLELGVLNEYVAASAPAILLQAVTQITALGGSSNTRASSYSTNILRAALATTPVAVGEATGQNNKGGWKVRARIYPSATTVRVRLAWRVGSGPYAHEPWRTVPGSAAWYDVDLGSVTIPEISVGTHSVTFRLEAMSTSGSPTVDLDVFEILPTDSYLKLRGASSLDTPTSAIVAMDDFSTQTSGAVTGKTPLLAPAGNWSGAGDADDFTVDTTAQNIYRDAVSDSALNNGRYLRCGSGTLALTAISCDVALSGSYPDFPSGRFGVFLRYTDTSNWLMAVICDFWTFKLIKRVAGTETVLGTYQDYSTIPFAAGGVIAAAVDATGNVLASVSRSGNSIAGLSVSADSSLATAGALASGGYGIYDAEDNGYSDPRTYDNFNVFTGSSSATISNPVILSGGAVEVTNNKAVTRNAGATAWADTPVREGKYPTLPPATRNSSKSLVVVKARRNDVDSAYTDTNLTDKLLLTASVTPRVHLTGT